MSLHHLCCSYQFTTDAWIIIRLFQVQLHAYYVGKQQDIEANTFICNYKKQMTEYLNQEGEGAPDGSQTDLKQEPSFHYQMTDIKARKLVTLIKFARLSYAIEENNDPQSPPFVLKTSLGELRMEYQIVSFVVNESRKHFQSQGNRKSQSFREISERESEGNDHRNTHELKVVSLGGNDNYMMAKMWEQLVSLRFNLFPILQEFYKYMSGHQRIKKSKYDNLNVKIKRQIGKLDALMNEHNQMFASENSFLNIIIVCQLFLACKFVFEEKFRKSKYSLFSKCEKISKRPEFEEVFGKASFCIKQYVPVEFQDQDDNEAKKTQELLPAEIVKISDSIAVGAADSPRNQLLYNYFRSVFIQQQSKQNYFPYYWLMFDNLACSLVQISYPPSSHSSFNQLGKTLKMVQLQLQKYIKPTIDYGLVGIYHNQGDKTHSIKGMLCLGSKSYDQLHEDLESSVQLKEFKLHRIDTGSQQERRKVQMLFEHVVEHNAHQNIVLDMLLYI